MIRDLREMSPDDFEDRARAELERAIDEAAGRARTPPPRFERPQVQLAAPAALMPCLAPLLPVHVARRKYPSIT